MSLVDQFEKFRENTVNLNPGRPDDLNKRVETIEGVLRAATEQPDLVIVDARPEGSFAQKTIMKHGCNRWLDARDDWANGHLVSAIRLCKYMRDFKGRPRIKSVIFTRLLADRVTGRTPSEYTDLPTTTLVLLLEDLSAWAATQYSPPYLTERPARPNCVCTTANWTAFQNQMKSVAGRARKALDETDEDKALVLWRDLSGSKFPAAEKRTASRVLDPFEEDLYLKYGIPTDVQDVVSIKARVARKDGYRSGELKSFGSVQPGRDLYFELETTSVTYPYDVYWKVKNTGAQARAFDNGRGLRGEISPDTNGAKAWRKESTKYTGDHYVEIYIVKDGVCVAKARQPVIIR